MDDLGSPFGLMGIMSMFASAMIMLLFMALWGGAILYILARWRQHRTNVEDPHFGLKFAAHMFRYLGFHLMLLGGFLVLYSVLMKSGGGRSSMWRSALGFLFAGGALFGVHELVLSSVTNQARFPMIRRMYAGLSLLTTGLIGSAALIVVAQLLFAKGSSGDAGRAAWSLLLVYGSAWVGQGLVYVARYAKSGGDTDAGPGPGPTPTAPPAPPVPEPMRQPLAPTDAP